MYMSYIYIYLYIYLCAVDKDDISNTSNHVLILYTRTHNRKYSQFQSMCILYMDILMSYMYDLQFMYGW